MPGRMQSLRDKLIKAGLVSEDQAKKAEPEVVVKRAPLPPRPPRAEGQEPPRAERPARPPREERGGRGPRPGGPQGGRRPPERAAERGAERGAERPIPKLPPMPGSRAFQQQESRKQLELDRKVRELVLAHQVPLDEGATVFYFMTRKKKLRRLTLTEAQAQRLERGELAVVERPDPDKIEHGLVPAEAAEQLLALSARAVRFFNRKESPIGFMTDEELKRQQQSEAEAAARGETDEGAEESARASGAEAAEGAPGAGGEDTGAPPSSGEPEPTA